MPTLATTTSAVLLVLLALCCALTVLVDGSAMSATQLRPDENTFCAALASPSSPLWREAEQLHGLVRACFICQAATVVVFLVWFRDNLAAVGKLAPRTVSIPPGWAIWGAFVPGLNLVAPVLGMTDALVNWTRSVRALPRWVGLGISSVWWFLVLRYAWAMGWVASYLPGDRWMRADAFSSFVRSVNDSSTTVQLALALTAVLVAPLAFLRARAVVGGAISGNVKERPTYQNTPYEVLGALTLTGAVLLFFVAFIGGVVWMIGPGLAQLVLARRFLVKTEARLQTSGAKPPVILLRSFVVDFQQRYKDSSTLEDAIAAGVAPFAPFVAIGAPGEWPPRTGASRDYVSDTEWQRAAERLIATAGHIVLIADGGFESETSTAPSGLAWEFDMIVAKGRLGDTAIVIPPIKSKKAWTTFVAQISKYGHELPNLPVETGGVLIFRKDGRPSIVHMFAPEGYRQAIANWLAVRLGRASERKSIPKQIMRPTAPRSWLGVRFAADAVWSVATLIFVGAAIVIWLKEADKEEVRARIDAYRCGAEGVPLTGRTNPCSHVTIEGASAFANTRGDFNMDVPNRQRELVATVEVAGRTFTSTVQMESRSGCW